MSERQTVSGRTMRRPGPVLSWARLEVPVHSIADWLSAHGFQRVALLADNGPDWVMADLAAMEAGLCLVPLPTFFSRQQLTHALEACQLEAVLTDCPAVLQGMTETGIAETVPSTSGLQLIPLTSCRGNGQVPLPAGTGKVTFTSGSTGTPKGVCLSHEQLRRQSRYLAEAVGLAQPRHLCVLPLSTLLENVSGVYTPLAAEGEVIVPPLDALGFQGSRMTNPALFLQGLEHYQPETLVLIPQLLNLLVEAVTSGWQAPESLRFIAVGGAKVAPTLLARARQSGLPVHEGYGLSECASVVSLNVPGADRPGSAGRPLPHVSVTIRENSEVCVSGNVMLGYLGEPESWYPAQIATGDIGQLDADGYLHLEGRLKHQLISSYGRNISPEWVECHLLAHDVIREAVIFGDARPYCVALIHPATADTPDHLLQSIIDTANEALPDYARIRRWRRLNQSLQSMPGLMTDNGRPRRQTIAELFHEQLELLYQSTEQKESTHVSC